MGLHVFDQSVFDFHSCCKMLLYKSMTVQKMIVINKLDYIFRIKVFDLCFVSFPFLPLQVNSEFPSFKYAKAGQIPGNLR